jgi:hypothetical protein
MLDSHFWAFFLWNLKKLVFTGLYYHQSPEVLFDNYGIKVSSLLSLLDC